MAYTNTWNGAYENTPGGGDQRSTVDDRIRELKRDIRERMESVFYWTIQDPITVRPEFSGIMNGKVLMLHASDFQIIDGASQSRLLASDFSAIVYSGSSSGFNVVFQAGLLLPVSAVVTGLRCWFYNQYGQGTSTLTQDIYYHRWGLAGANSLGFANTQLLGANQTVYTAQVNSQALIADRMYFIRVTATTTPTSGSVNVTPNFYGAEVTYNVPTATALR